MANVRHDGGWATSGKSKAHYVYAAGFRGGPAVCGAMPNNGLWRNHPGLTKRYCFKCSKLADKDRTVLDSNTIPGPVARIVLALKRLIGWLLCRRHASTHVPN